MPTRSVLVGGLALLVGACSPFGAAPENEDASAAADGGVVGDAAPGADAASPSALPVSCKALHEQQPAAPSGITMIDPDGPGPGPARKVYCDMVIDGGGWMLVARSAPNSDTQTFGWSLQTGAPDVDGDAYSADVASMGVTFTTLLFGEYTTGKTWGTPVYRRTVPSDFLTSCATKACTSVVSPVTGGCATPSMLKQFGHTSAKGYYFFRDQTEVMFYGLRSNRWESNGESPPKCSYDALLDQKQAMIFVR